MNKSKKEYSELKENIKGLIVVVIGIAIFFGIVFAIKSLFEFISTDYDFDEEIMKNDFAAYTPNNDLYVNSNCHTFNTNFYAKVYDYNRLKIKDEEMAVASYIIGATKNGIILQLSNGSKEYLCFVPSNEEDAFIIGEIDDNHIIEFVDSRGYISIPDGRVYDISNRQYIDNVDMFQDKHISIYKEELTDIKFTYDGTNYSITEETYQNGLLDLIEKYELYPVEIFIKSSKCAYVVFKKSIAPLRELALITEFDFETNNLKYAMVALNTYDIKDINERIEVEFMPDDNYVQLYRE